MNLVQLNHQQCWTGAGKDFEATERPLFQTTATFIFVDALPLHESSYGYVTSEESTFLQHLHLATQNNGWILEKSEANLLVFTKHGKKLYYFHSTDLGKEDTFSPTLMTMMRKATTVYFHGGFSYVPLWDITDAKLIVLDDMEWHLYPETARCWEKHGYQCYFGFRSSIIDYILVRNRIDDSDDDKLDEE